MGQSRSGVQHVGIALVVLALLSSCGSSPGSEPSVQPLSGAGRAAPATAARGPVTEVGRFPAFPQGDLPGPLAVKLQEVLDAAVHRGAVRGATAAVIVVDAGSWSGAAGVDTQGRPLSPHSALMTASVGKTVTAAEVLRLVDEGKLGLDDKASGHFPHELSAFTANGATIRDLLGMRSSLTDPPSYVDLVDQGQRTPELVKVVGRRTAPPGTTYAYANINYLLLGEVIEQVTGRTLEQAVRAGVLNAPGLEGIRYPVKDSMAGDGWRIEADAATLARWGYELYGGSVVSDTALRAMTDFQVGGYGLGTKDFSREYRVPNAIGHGGQEESHVVRMVAFPDSGVVVTVQANADDFDSIHELVSALRTGAAQAPSG